MGSWLCLMSQPCILLWLLLTSVLFRVLLPSCGPLQFFAEPCVITSLAPSLSSSLQFEASSLALLPWLVARSGDWAGRRRDAVGRPSDKPWAPALFWWLSSLNRPSKLWCFRQNTHGTHREMSEVLILDLELGLMQQGPPCHLLFLWLFIRAPAYFLTDKILLLKFMKLEFFKLLRSDFKI